MNGSSCNIPVQFELSFDLLFHVLDTNQDFLDILGMVGCQQIQSWINNKVLPLEPFTAFYSKAYLQCFDDYMNNVVKGMNLAAKKSDMSAKPKDNMDIAADKNAESSQSKIKDQKV